MKVYMTSSDKTAMSLNPAITVEAEFGSVLVKGSVYTLAHHEAGKAQGFNECPCLMPNCPIGFDAADICVISHLDWDTIGGVLAIMGEKPVDGFWTPVWEQIAFNDENGSHRGHLSGVTCNMDVVNAMYWWMTLEENRIYAPRDGSALDVTEFFETVKAFLAFLEAEVTGFTPFGKELEKVYLTKGKEWIESQVTLEKESFVDSIYAVTRDFGPIGEFVRITGTKEELKDTAYYEAEYYMPFTLIRQAEVFVNHLYTHDSKVYYAVVGFNQKTGAITLSFENGKNPPASAGELLQEYFPVVALQQLKGYDDLNRPIWETISEFDDKSMAPDITGDNDFRLIHLAGGHKGIGGTPRGRVYTLEKAIEFAKFVSDFINYKV